MVVLFSLLITACGDRTETTISTEPTATTAAVTSITSESGAAIRSGRAALAAAQGEPHVLWFWGAH